MKLILKSLINNNACIDGARKRKWWVALLILLFSLICAVIPTFVSSITTKGGQLISGNAYGVDMAINGFVNERSDIKLIVNDDKTLSVSNWQQGEAGVYEYKYNGDVDAKIYYFEDYSSANFAELCGERKYTNIVFTNKDFYIDLVSPTNETEVRALICTNAWKDYSTGDDVFTFLKAENYPDIRSNFVSFLDKAYNYQRVSQAWVTTGIMSAINLFVTLLMGLLIWILTRGKTNPFRLYTFWEGQKISMWAALAPGVLAIPFGFLFKNFMNMLFPMLLGVRVMWLSMKSLRPDGTGYIDSKEVKTVDVKTK